MMGIEGRAEKSRTWTENVAAAVCVHQCWFGVQKLLCRQFCTDK